MDGSRVIGPGQLDGSRVIDPGQSTTVDSTNIDCRTQIQKMNHAAATFVPDSWCAAHIKCGGFSTLWPFCKTAIFRLPLIGI
jgi:hypothetical protein